MKIIDKKKMIIELENTDFSSLNKELPNNIIDSYKTLKDLAKLIIPDFSDTKCLKISELKYLYSDVEEAMEYVITFKFEEDIEIFLTFVCMFKHKIEQDEKNIYLENLNILKLNKLSKFLSDIRKIDISYRDHVDSFKLFKNIDKYNFFKKLNNNMIFHVCSSYSESDNSNTIENPLIIIKKDNESIFSLAPC